MNPSLLPEIGPDGLPREAPVIAYTKNLSLSGKNLSIFVSVDWTIIWHLCNYLLHISDNRRGTASITKLIDRMKISLALTIEIEGARKGPTQEREYIQENYSNIHDVERELANLSLELKLTAGPKQNVM
ncbi:hypothetical protein NE237_027149 [Protea cynaroides]|uniref:Uncharacterized protein n=1 Tax=Protea cynaroides TaxID=273540 RepID=A0A9Q0GM06_9MAGN|nr:hypothetical protein NE237_027149 [Protea cynaroides]